MATSPPAPKAPPPRIAVPVAKAAAPAAKAPAPGVKAPAPAAKAPAPAVKSPAPAAKAPAAPPTAAPAAPRAQLLVVDDDSDLRALLAMMLKPRYEVRLASNGKEALLGAAKSPQPELILLDVQMPGEDGHAVLQALRANPATASIPVIFLTARNDPKDEAKGLALGAIDYITKPISAAIVLARLATHIALANRNRALEAAVSERTRELKDTRAQLMQRLALALSYREGGLTHRSVRVGQYAKFLAEAAGAKPDACEMMAIAAPLHDIGTLGVPESILRSPDKLNEREWQEMRKHPEIGAEIIGPHRDPLLATARVIALCHHERWDGGGYPKGLAGAAIPWAARVAAVADAFEAMTATLRYRQPMAVAAAAKIITSESGKQFDPAIVQAFTKALPKMIAVHKSVHDELAGFHDLNFSPEKPAK